MNSLIPALSPNIPVPIVAVQHMPPLFTTSRRKGGYSLVQDESTSVVWGMPGVVAERGCADEILPLPEIPARIMQIFNR